MLYKSLLNNEIKHFFFSNSESYLGFIYIFQPISFSKSLCVFHSRTWEENMNNASQEFPRFFLSRIKYSRRVIDIFPELNNVIHFFLCFKIRISGLNPVKFLIMPENTWVNCVSAILHIIFEYVFERWFSFRPLWTHIRDMKCFLWYILFILCVIKKWETLLLNFKKKVFKEHYFSKFYYTASYFSALI